MNSFILDPILRRALEEDIGTGDVTTMATIALGTQASAELVAKEDFVLAGIDVAQRVFQLLSAETAFEKLMNDGQSVKRGDVLAWIKGDASVLLQGERVALNLLQRMCGVATLTAAFVKEVEGTRAVVVDTRKTTPGLRVLEKYSVRMGGGGNHRMALYDAVLIKENHVAAAGGITAAVSRAQQRVPHTQKIEVEVAIRRRWQKLWPLVQISCSSTTCCLKNCLWPLSWLAIAPSRKPPGGSIWKVSGLLPRLASA